MPEGSSGRTDMYVEGQKLLLAYYSNIGYLTIHSVMTPSDNAGKASKLEAFCVNTAGVP